MTRTAAGTAAFIIVWTMIVIPAAFGQRADYDGMPVAMSLKKVDAIAAGADPSGAADSAPALAAAVAAGHTRLVIPCGTYRLKANVPLPSDTEVVGRGACTTLLIDPTMTPNDLYRIVLPSIQNVRSVFSNADFDNGNSNIAIRNLRVAAPVPLVRGQYHAFSFYKADHVSVENTSVEGTGTIHDGNHTVFIRSHDFRYTHNRHTGPGGEASFDIWDGSYNFVVNDNFCDGGYAIQRCFTVNGLSSGNLKAGLENTGRTTSNGVLAHNRAEHVKNVGIMIVGLYSPGPPPVYGHVHNVAVRDNVVVGVSKFHGIWIGEADHVDLVGNRVRDAAKSCIYVASGSTAGVTEDIEVDHNSCENSGATAAIIVGNGKDAPHDVSLVDNRVSADQPSYGYAVRVEPGAVGTSFAPGAMVAGTSGILLDRGSRDHASQDR